MPTIHAVEWFDWYVLITKAVLCGTIVASFIGIFLIMYVSWLNSLEHFLDKACSEADRNFQLHYPLEYRRSHGGCRQKTN